jgi:hypothetical protein
MTEVAELMGKIRSMKDVMQVLGKPDRTVTAPKAAAGENGKVGYKSHHHYLKRWRTLDLTIREHRDGSVDSAFTGKYKGKRSQSTKKHSSSQSWD